MTFKWQIIKNMLNEKAHLELQWIDMTSHYIVAVYDGPFKALTKIKKTSPANADQTDFETNYKSGKNQRIATAVIKDETTGDKAGVTSTNRLKVDALVNQQADGAPGCAVISKKLRIERDGSDITLNTSTYTSIYSYSGSGKFFGAALDFNSNKIQIKLTIDASDVIFDLDFQTIEDMGRFGGGDDKGSSRDLCKFFRIGASDRIEFCPPCALEYTSEVKIEAKATSGSSRKLTDKFVFLTKET